MTEQELAALVEQQLADMRKKTESAQAEMKSQIDSTLVELRKTIAQESDEIKRNGAPDPGTLAKLEKLEAKVSTVEAQMKNAAAASDPPLESKSVGTRLIELPEFKAWTEQLSRGVYKGDRFPVGSTFERKTTVTRDTLGFPTTGIVPMQRVPGMFGIGMQPLRIRDIMRVRPTSAGAVDYIKKTARTVAASPQVEGSSKAESSFTMTAASTTVRTIAHFMQFSRQVLDDVPGLREDIDMELMYGLKLTEEDEILSGDGTGVHLSGLITNAASYDTGLNVGGDTKLDKLRHAILQVRQAFFPVDAIVINPKDYHDIELLKDEEKRYLVGDPKTGAQPTIWGKPVVESDSIDSGYFLPGSFALGAILFDRAAATIDISFEAGNNFTENEVTIRCEERLALATVRPTCFVYGAF